VTAFDWLTNDRFARLKPVQTRPRPTCRGAPARAICTLRLGNATKPKAAGTGGRAFMSASAKIFLSTVSDEFRAYRDQLRSDLTRPNVEVKVQEDFKDQGARNA
jgi:hypothetical protein